VARLTLGALGFGWGRSVGLAGTWRSNHAARYLQLAWADATAHNHRSIAVLFRVCDSAAGLRLVRGDEGDDLWHGDATGNVESGTNRTSRRAVFATNTLEHPHLSFGNGRGLIRVTAGFNIGLPWGILL